MPWPLYLALKQLFPTGRWFPFFTVMSCLGVTVGVTLMYVTSSVMGGFGHQIRQMIVDTQGEIQVVSNQPIENHEELVVRVEAVPGVAAATPVALGKVALQAGSRREYPEIQGVDPATVGGVFALDRYLRGATLDALDDDSVFLSVQLARTLGVRIGGEVELFAPRAIERFLENDEAILPRIFRVAGVFEIGHQELDRNLAICTLRTMQDILGLEAAVHGLMVRIEPGADEMAVALRVNQAIAPRHRALTWFESNAAFQSIVRLEKTMIMFLLGFIVVVAAISIMTSLLITVVRKTREIGLLGALGGGPWMVASCFCIQGFFLGVVGTASGLALGGVIVAFRNQIVNALTSLTVGREAFLHFYGFIDLPAYIARGDLVAIIIGSILCSTLAGLIPAWRAARLKPVEALRSE